MSDQTLIRSNADILNDGRERLAAGEKVILATVASTWGSSPRPAGSLMILTDSGYSAGSVTGGCIEQELLSTVKEGFPVNASTLEYDGESNRSLPSGGKLLVILEPLNELEDLKGLISALKGGKKLHRIISIREKRSIWTMEEDLRIFDSEEEVFRIQYDPAWRILIVGFGDLGRRVSAFAEMLDYNVSVCEPREEYEQL